MTRKVSQRRDSTTRWNQRFSMTREVCTADRRPAIKIGARARPDIRSAHASDALAFECNTVHERMRGKPEHGHRPCRLETGRTSPRSALRRSLQPGHRVSLGSLAVADRGSRLEAQARARADLRGTARRVVFGDAARPRRGGTEELHG